MSSDIASLKLGTRADGLQELRVHYPDHYHRDWADWKELELNAPETWHEATGEARASERAHLYDADIALLRAEAVVALSNPAAEQTRGDAQRLASYIDSLRVARIDLALDHESGQPTEGAASPVWSLKQAVVEVLNARADGDYLHRLRPWREQPLVSGPESLHWILSKQNCGALPLPILRNTGDYHIGFVVPIFQFGGVEKCVVSLARSLKRKGVKCHLFVYGDGAMTGVDWLTEPFETIHQFNDWVLRDWNGRNYLGTTMATEPNPTVLRDLVSALTGMDAVIVSGCAAAYYGFSNLRNKGIKTLTYEHLLERDNFGRSFGTPYLAVAYEGGIDRILTCSHQLRDWLHGQGVPWEKLLALPNGPGFPMPSDRIADALRIRQERSSDVPLRVGFLGRFDRQKGADRFVDLVSRCKGLPIKFSITGSAVLDDGGVSIPDFVERHPAAYSCEELEAAFDRLDVLLMPSRDEGLPLTIMEAQRVGVIPVVTDVGAVSEAIEDGENGFLIAGPDVVQQMVLLLNRLVSEPDLRSSLVQGASETEAIWDGNAARLLGFLQPQMLAAS